LFLIILLLGVVFFRFPPTYRHIIAYCLFFHLLLLVINTYFYAIPPMSTSDPKDFLINALFYSNVGFLDTGLGNGAQYYAYFLSVLYDYSFFTSNILLLAQLSSVLFWLISAFLLIKIAEKLGFTAGDEFYLKLALLLFSLTPHLLVISTGVFREGIQLMFTMLAAFSLLTWNENKNFFYFILAVLLFVLAGVWHVGVLIAAVLLFILLFALVIPGFFSGSGRTPFGKQIFILLCLLVFSYFAFYCFLALKQGFVTMALDYSSKVSLANTAYPPFASQGTYFSVLLGWLYYLFYPFLWKIDDGLSLYFSLFGVLTLVLLIFSLASYFFEKNETIRDAVLILLLLFVLISLVYSIGTSNYGTAMRHGFLSFWILLLLGARGFLVLRARFLGESP